MRDYTPEETVRFDASFEAGVREAMSRGSGLLLAESQINGIAVWAALFPPGKLSMPEGAVWAACTGLQLSEKHRYLPRSEVERAAAELGI